MKVGVLLDQVILDTYVKLRIQLLNKLRNLSGSWLKVGLNQKICCVIANLYFK